MAPAATSTSGLPVAVAPRGACRLLWARPLAVGSGLGLLAGAVALVNPFEHHLWPPCPLHAMTGLWCPFCGGTRAVWALAHLRLRLMLHENALLPLIVVVVAWGWAAWLGRATGRWRLPDPRGRTFDLVMGAVLLAFVVLRNLPWLGVLAPLAKP